MIQSRILFEKWVKFLESFRPQMIIHGLPVLVVYLAPIAGWQGGAGASGIVFDRFDHVGGVLYDSLVCYMC